MTLPLEGLTVIAVEQAVAAPFCSSRLADAGAHVIKVEDLEGSDVTRHNPPYVNGESHYFLSLNRNKESIALDLKKPEGLAIVRELAAQSDIVVENFRPGVAERIGIGYQALSASNPRLVYCSISGFGQTGPWRDRTALPARGAPLRPCAAARPGLAGVRASRRSTVKLNCRMSRSPRASTVMPCAPPPPGRFTALIG